MDAITNPVRFLCSRRRIGPGFGLLLAALLVFLLAGCRSVLHKPSSITGNIMLWHSWDEADAMVLEQVLAQVTEISPRTTVVAVYVPRDGLLQRYITATQQGVGPDLLLGADAWVQQLVEAQVVRPVPLSAEDLATYDPNAMAALRYATEPDNLGYYGFPLSLYPIALYRNTKLAAESPITLDEMVALAEKGESMAIVPRFVPAYWGIQTFGSGLFDAAGNFTLAESGFVELLSWLNDVQHEPGMVLNVDEAALEEMYMEQRAAFFASGPEDLRLVSDALGSSSIDVGPLPSGPHGPSGPILSVEAVMLSTASSKEQSKIALIVAQFLTNPQQSTTFMRELGRVPANRRVDVDPRIYPILSGFAQQSRTAVALPNNLYREAFYLLGDRAYANTLSGLLTPEEATCEFGLAVVELQGYTEDQADLPEGCVASAVDTE